MINIAENVWVFETDFKMFGADFGNRMTAIRHSGGRLLLHSPIKMNSELLKSVMSLGDVSHIVTPNNFHGQFVDPWLSEFPDAKYFTARNSTDSEKVGLPISLLDETELGDSIRVVKIEGVPKLNEYAFIQTATNTLILTDLAFNIRPGVSWWSRVFFKLNRAFDRFGPSRMMKSMITDTDSFKSSIDEILSFDIDRVVVSHGELLEEDAKLTLTQAFKDR